MKRHHFYKYEDYEDTELPVSCIHSLKNIYLNLSFIKKNEVNKEGRKEEKEGRKKKLKKLP